MVISNAVCWQVRAKLPPGVDGWGYSLKGMMSMVVVGGFLITATYFLLQRTIVKQVPPPKKPPSCHCLESAPLWAPFNLFLKPWRKGAENFSASLVQTPHQVTCIILVKCHPRQQFSC